MQLSGAPEFNASLAAPLGQSALLRNTCSGEVTGTANPDGQCVLGGTYVGGVCRADPPVWYMEMVPYTTGRVASSNYARLNTIYDRGNNTTLNRNWALRVGR